MQNSMKYLINSEKLTVVDLDFNEMVSLNGGVDELTGSVLRWFGRTGAHIANFFDPMRDWTPPPPPSTPY